MRNQKAVLCEKPFAVNAKEVETMIRVSKKRMCFSWKECGPASLPDEYAEGWLRQGKLGEIRTCTRILGFYLK